MKTPSGNTAIQRTNRRANRRTNRWTSQAVGKRIALAAATTALTFGFAGGAFAQTTQDTVGGSTTDMTSAGNANGGGLPQIQHQGAIEYVSGGVGLDESAALKSEAHRWPLSMRFTGPTADYLADVHVRIVGPHGADVLSTESMGPYMLVKLPPGKYTVHARYKDEEQTRTVMVSSQPGARADFHWSMQ
jgi:hypothetical protein